MSLTTGSRPDEDTDDVTPEYRETPVTATALRRQLGAAVRVLLALTLLLGVVYPAGVWAISRIPGLSGPAEGSLLPGRSGSSLIGIDPVPANPAADPWFHTRASASAPDDTVAGLGPADATTSGGSNLGATAEDLVTAVDERRAAIAAREGVDHGVVPPDALTASASGVDPHVSPAYAALQAPRVARVTGLGEPRVAELVERATGGRTLGFLGEPRVNVTELNALLREAAPTAR